MKMNVRSYLPISSNCNAFVIYLRIDHDIVYGYLDMIGEVAPLTNTFVSVPQEIEGFNCASFIAGIIAGVLDSAKFVSSIYCYVGIF